MQTNFTIEQMRDPAIARSNKVLRTCVHCGFCTATCPTYQVLGDELDSPRGRIYLIKDMLEKGRPADEKTVKHIDRCLSCLACMSTCPSGVHYMHLVDHAREYIEQTYTRPLPERALRWLLARIIPYPNRFRLAMFGARFAKPFAAYLPDRLKAMVELAPSSMPSPSPKASSTRVAAHSWRQYRQISRSDPGRCCTSVEPHFGHWFRPSRSSLDAVSIEAGSGASSSSRIGSGSVLGSSGSMGCCPGARGMSCGEPCPVGPGFGLGAMRCAGPYRPSALAFTAS